MANRAACRGQRQQRQQRACWQKPTGVQHHCFDGNNKQRL
jgi:hypothetical protein